MGRFVFKLPDIGEGVAEAEIVAWHVKVGDTVAEDQPLVDIMTDKATVEMTSPVAGVVLSANGEIGDMTRVGSPLVEIEIEGDGPADAPAPIPAEPMPVARPGPAPEPPRGETPLAAPAVRARARELGVPLHQVPGTGPEGRITAGDLAAFVASGQVRTAGVEAIKIVGLRRKIAEKMQEAKRRIPHFGYVEAFDLTDLEELRARLNAARRPDQPKLTLLPFFMRALAEVLPDYPQINARYDDDAGVLHQHEAVHIGIATQTPAGLTVAVVTHVEARDLWDCAGELARVTGAAKAGTAEREELSGSTITLSSLGPLGGLVAMPVINYPEVAIIAPNKLEDRAVVQGGQIVVRRMMNVSSAFDHRIVDGHDAAEFIQRLRRLIETPAMLAAD